MPFTCDKREGPGGLDAVDPSAFGGGSLFPVNEDISVSSGIVVNFFKTCFNAGLRIGLLRK